MPYSHLETNSYNARKQRFNAKFPKPDFPNMNQIVSKRSETMEFKQTSIQLTYIGAMNGKSRPLRHL
jgi:hypothetical protein